MLSKVFHSIGHDNAADEKDTLQKIFRTIDTDGTGSCSIEELTVGGSLMIVIKLNLEKIKKREQDADLKCYKQVFLKKLFYTPQEIEEVIKMADSDHSGEVKSDCTREKLIV